MTTSLGVAAVLLLAITITRSDHALERQLEATEQPGELVYVPPARVLKFAALGYQHALADLLWFRTISYFGRHYRSDRVYPWLAYMCDVVTDLDPSAEHVYHFGGLILPWEAGGADEGIGLLKKGVRNLPNTWELRYMLGFSYYFFKDDLPAAARELQAATVLPRAPEFVSRLAAMVYAMHQGPSKATDFLTELERNSSSEIRGIIGERIRELALARDIEILEGAVKGFQAAFQRLPADLDELVSTGIVAALPEEPFGGRYVLDPVNGSVQSSLGHKPWTLGSSTLRESYLKHGAPRKDP